MERATTTQPTAPVKESTATDLLFADLDKFTQSMWRNEEVGEKRFSFFLTLVTAVASGLIALDGGKSPPNAQTIGLALLGLLLIGIMTYLRMLKRNRVTDEYKKTLTVIRKRLIVLCPELQGYEVPVGDRSGLWAKFFSGGYAETIGVINSALLCGYLCFYWGICIIYPVLAAVLFLIAQWIPPVLRHLKK